MPGEDDLRRAGLVAVGRSKRQANRRADRVRSAVSKRSGAEEFVVKLVARGPLGAPPGTRSKLWARCRSLVSFGCRRWPRSTVAPTWVVKGRPSAARLGLDKNIDGQVGREDPASESPSVQAAGESPGAMLVIVQAPVTVLRGSAYRTSSS